MTELTIGKERNGAIMIFDIWRGEKKVFFTNNFDSRIAYINWETDPELEKEEVFKEAAVGLPPGGGRPFESCGLILRPGPARRYS